MKATKSYRTASLIAAAAITAGCATASKDLTPAYVSPLQYQNYNCDQLSAESARISVRVQQVSGRLDDAATHDKQLMGVGLILFWPALFALGGTKEQEAEYSRLKGEYEAIQQAANTRNCLSMARGLVTENTSPTALKVPASPTTSESVEDQLRKLKALFDQGLISKDVYQERQTAILANK